ncbi:MAG TPA: hypothetical protein DER01_07200 [Phycisphaerales bacterium]|nr:hypothetical protein [Phycisphaerales bacterium]|tara:strand:+ start:631 stop:975 length:345 start_codon:yes stop_codon:yes gene_type:complete
MPRPNRQRDVTFRVIDDHLEMHVTFKHQPDRNYVHRCTRDVFRDVAYAIEDHAAGGTTHEQIVHVIDAPCTQVNVALAFMKERGCVETRHRRTFPASDIVYEDAMIEFMHLADH